MIDVLQVPYDSGRRGVRMGAGPLRLVQDGIVEHLAGRGHDTRLVSVELEDGLHAEAAAAFRIGRIVRARVQSALLEQRLPLVLAGNCITSIGIIAALHMPAVYWFDAHADLNTPETTRTGFLDGMALAVSLGYCWSGLARDLGLQPLPASRVRLIGARDLDPAERTRIDAGEIRCCAPGHPFTSDDCVPGGGDAYLHIDLDVLDPGIGEANQFAAPGGLSLENVLDAMSTIAAHHRIAALALTALDPQSDIDGRITEAAFRIAARAAALRDAATRAPLAP